MKYEGEARAAIRSGDVLAWSHSKWRSWYDFKVQMVRVFTQSEYCHVGLAWVIAERVFILESVTAGVRLFPLSKELPCYWIPTSLDWTEQGEEFALAQLGEPYSQFQAMLAFFDKDDKSDQSIWECAKYVQAVLAKLGVDLPGRATPSAVVLDLQRRGYPVMLMEADDGN